MHLVAQEIGYKVDWATRMWVCGSLNVKVYSWLSEELTVSSEVLSEVIGVSSRVWGMVWCLLQVNSLILLLSSQNKVEIVVSNNIFFFSIIENVFGGSFWLPHTSSQGQLSTGSSNIHGKWKIVSLDCLSNIVTFALFSNTPKCI